MPGKRVKVLSIVTCLLVLIGCSSLNPPAEFRQKSLDDFTSALRWKRFAIAASHMKPELRQDFLSSFKEVKDIHIVDVRVTKQLPENEGRRLETTIEMDYYLLPSVSVKTFDFDQTWVYFDTEDQPLHGFFITTPFPPFP